MDAGPLPSACTPKCSLYPQHPGQASDKDLSALKKLELTVAYLWDMPPAPQTIFNCQIEQVKPRYSSPLDHQGPALMAFFFFFGPISIKVGNLQSTVQHITWITSTVSQGSCMR